MSLRIPFIKVPYGGGSSQHYHQERITRLSQTDSFGIWRWSTEEFTGRVSRWDMETITEESILTDPERWTGCRVRIPTDNYIEPNITDNSFVSIVPRKNHMDLASELGAVFYPSVYTYRCAIDKSADSPPPLKKHGPARTCTGVVISAMFPDAGTVGIFKGMIACRR